MCSAANLWRQELFPSEIEKIARLGYGLASNHAFVDGNKRIGALMTQLLLQWNGYRIELEAGELADMFISVADNTANKADLLEWIRQHYKIEMEYVVKAYASPSEKKREALF